jgi:Holliday junction resolvase
MKEREMERKLVQAVKMRGGLAVKLVCPGYDGMPDRLLLFPKGKVAFVEVKAKGYKPRPLQLRRHEALQRLGFLVYVLDDERYIQQIINEIGGVTSGTEAS